MHQDLNSLVTAVAYLQAEFAGLYLTALPYFFNWRPYCEFHNNFAQHVILLLQFVVYTDMP